MNKEYGKFLRAVPNILTATRLVLALSLFLFVPLSAVFMTLYIIAGFTDLFDGPLARKFGSASTFGANFDGLVDMVFIVIALFLIVPVMVLPSWAIPAIIGIMSIRVISMLVCYARFRKWMIMHTVANKALAFIAWLVPVAYLLVDINLVFGALCVYAFLAFAEEFYLSASQKVPNPDHKGILFERGSAGEGDKL